MSAQNSSTEPQSQFTIEIEQLQDFEFRVKFDNPSLAALDVDEPAPLGRDSGPSPSRLLAAAVGNCLSASLLFCARKARVDLGSIRTTVTTTMERNEQNRLRIGRIDVAIQPSIDDENRDKARRCLALFEDFCVVTQSVRDGIEIGVSVAGFEE